LQGSAAGIGGGAILQAWLVAIEQHFAFIDHFCLMSWQIKVWFGPWLC
jgi:hypothetical protein